MGGGNDEGRYYAVRFGKVRFAPLSIRYYDLTSNISTRFSAKEQPVWTQAARINWKRIFVQVFLLSFLDRFLC